MIPHTNEIKAEHNFFLGDVGSSKNIFTHNFILLTQGFKLCGTVSETGTNCWTLVQK